jgi:hypothetical protein
MSDTESLDELITICQGLVTVFNPNSIPMLADSAAAELAQLKGELHQEINWREECRMEIIRLRADLAAATKRVESARGVCTDILEYWNGLENQSAMSDALKHYQTVAAAWLEEQTK